ncbi:hypothetical protein FHR81_002873 [Actinoalloteichus hoggarensis]|uniref:Uncharacterized protein n=1 Tax=Actinoalloteichus hoggarensis TaxID=1470176 RepID=A0A221VY51_9PSEU|nr:hypothetical protein AHOG_04050 [Actinoalloteichus hoggarensis]MBB5921833.1 hypothetical protein [Actinoalloteichus hoggarensis]
MERHQVPGRPSGRLPGLQRLPSRGPPGSRSTPVLPLLLYAPSSASRSASSAERSAIGGYSPRSSWSTVLVPAVVWLLSWTVAHDQVLLVGVLFALPARCIDYAILFAGLVGGDAEKLLAAPPLPMFAQTLLLPLYLWLFVGAEFVRPVEFAPFTEAFALTIIAPLVAAALTRLAAARSRAGPKVGRTVTGAMARSWSRRRRRGRLTGRRRERRTRRCSPSRSAALR